MNGKSPDAFRTISEVADWLDRPAHVLRFWESKFTQVKPVKRAGGRRYYRPEDMRLLGGIKKLLHDDGMTIKGAQKVLREQGVRYVSALSPPLDDEEALMGVALDMTGAMVANLAHPPEPEAAPAPAPAPAPEAKAAPDVQPDTVTAEPVTVAPDPLPDMDAIVTTAHSTEPAPVAAAPTVTEAAQTQILGIIAALTAPVPPANRPAVAALLLRLDSLSARMAQAQQG